MNRRNFLVSTGALLAHGSLHSAFPEYARALAQTTTAKADHQIRIEPATVTIGRGVEVKTLTYSGQVPGPLLRMKEGVPVTVNVVNKTDVPEFVHFHGLLIPSDVDGSEEEGTPEVPPHGEHRGAPCGASASFAGDRAPAGRVRLRPG